MLIEVNFGKASWQDEIRLSCCVSMFSNGNLVLQAKLSKLPRDAQNWLKGTSMGENTIFGCS